MNKTQKAILMIYIPLTILIIVFRVLYKDGNPSLYLMYAVRISMLLGVMAIGRRYSEKKIIALAFLFTVISDYFFVYVKTFEPAMTNRELYGMIGFITAYLCLIAAFHRNFKIGLAEVVTAVPFVAVFATVFLSLQVYVKGFMYPAALVLGAVLCFAAWTMVSTLYRGYFSRKSAWMIGLSGCVLFLSDMVVAYSIFHPEFKGFILWKENVIWGTYMPGWILLMLAVAEKQMVVSKVVNPKESIIK